MRVVCRGPGQPGPADQRPVLALFDPTLILAVEPRSALDQHARTVEGMDIALDERAHGSGPGGIERGFQHGGQDRSLRYGEGWVAKAPCRDAIGGLA